MKVLVKSYTFTPSTRRIVFSDYANIDLEQLLLITNTTSNTIIYNFAKQGLGATKVNANTIELSFDTTSMNSADRLQIFIEAPSDSLTSSMTTLSSRFVLSAATIFEVNGISTYGQKQYLQIRSGSVLSASNLIYTGILLPGENFNINFNKGITIPGNVVQIINSSNPITVEMNNNNLLFTVSYIK